MIGKELAEITEHITLALADLAAVQEKHKRFISIPMPITMLEIAEYRLNYFRHNKTLLDEFDRDTAEKVLARFAGIPEITADIFAHAIQYALQEILKDKRAT